MAIDAAKFIGRFVAEARDHLARLDQGVADFSQSSAPASASDIDALFRAAHTIKGSSRMLRLTSISDTAHAIEDVLGALRSGQISADASLGALLQRGLDQIGQAIDLLARDPDPSRVPPKDEALCAALSAAAGGSPLAPEPASQPASQPASAPVQGSEVAPAGLTGSETVRVPLAQLDTLIRLMGEVIAEHDRLRLRAEESQRLAKIAESARAAGWEGFARGLRDEVKTQETLMRELHDRALTLRMLPLSILFDPAARNGRELARALGKEVRCTLVGAEIALDRQAIDQLADPLVHLLRNAVDHGLETPEERRAAGKPPQGALRLTARQDGGWVEIDISDDGRGIDLAAVREKAIRKGLLGAEQAAAASDSEIIDLIFAPGFSTSALITDLSGRGVGMDVVKTTVVNRLQGNIQVRNHPGQGASFHLRVPVSLAIMRVLLIESGGETHGFLAQHVVEVLRVPRAQLRVVAERRAVILRNEFVPVMPLAELLHPGAGALPTAPDAAEPLLVVLRIGKEKLALEVDALRDERDLVVKPVPAQLRHLVLVSGFVTTGALDLVCILHAPAVLEQAARARGQSVRSQARAHADAPQRRLLVVDDSLNTREIEKDVLEAQGYRVILAEDGLDGLQKAMKEPFDAVLTDVEMPRMDGFTLTERLRALETYRTTPIIIVTSREKEEDRQRGLRVGADAYIVKGDFDQNNLISTLDALLC